MAIHNIYYGSTHTQSGGTFLDTKAHIKVEEGYRIGASDHYVNLGEFDVVGINNGGPFSQLLDLNIQSPVFRVGNNSSEFPRIIKSHTSYFDDFDDVNNLFKYSTDSSSWGITNGVLRATSLNGEQSIATLSEIESISDSVTIIKYRASEFSTGDASAGILAGISYADGANGYLGRHYLGQFRLQRMRGGSITSNYSTTNVGLTANDTYYYMMMSVRGNNIRLYGSTNGMNYTLHNNVDSTDYPVGSIGIFASGTSTAVVDIDYVESNEIGSKPTYGDIVVSSANMANIWGISISSKLENFSSFERNVGSSWVLGNSNNVFLINRSGGSFYDIFQTPGTSFVFGSQPMIIGPRFEDFVAEVEVRGASGNYAGLGILNTPVDNTFGDTAGFRFYGNNIRFSDSGTSLSNHIFRGWFDEDLGSNNGLDFIDSRGDYFCAQPNQWYKLKLVKNNNELKFYVNGLLTNFVQGLSWPQLDLAFGPNAYSEYNEFKDLSIGLFSYRRGNAGSTTEFRNFAISNLDQVAESVIYNAGDALDFNFRRYMPLGFDSIYSNDMVKILKIGDSRTSLNIGLSKIEKSSELLSNTIGNDQTIVTGPDSSGRVINRNTRISTQVDSSRTTFINDQNALNKTSAQDLAREYSLYDNADSQVVDFSLTPRVKLELYDRINFNNNALGISTIFKIYNFTKRFDAQTGDFTQSFNVRYDS